MPPEDRYGTYGAGSPEGRFFDRLFPMPPPGYPEFASDAYLNPAINQFTSLPLERGTPDVYGPVYAYGGRGGHLSVHQHTPKPEYSETGLTARYPFDARNPNSRVNRTDRIEAPIVNYPISNRPRLAHPAPGMMDYLSGNTANTQDLVNDLTQSIIERVFGLGR